MCLSEWIRVIYISLLGKLAFFDEILVNANKFQSNCLILLLNRTFLFLPLVEC